MSKKQKPDCRRCAVHWLRNRVDELKTDCFVLKCLCGSLAILSCALAFSAAVG